MTEYSLSGLLDRIWRREIRLLGSWIAAISFKMWLVLAAICVAGMIHEKVSIDRARLAKVDQETSDGRLIVEELTSFDVYHRRRLIAYALLTPCFIALAAWAKANGK